MKKTLFLAYFLFFSISVFSQTTVSFHQSNLPFLGVNYQFGERFIPEFRVGTDQYFEDLSLELAGNYILKKENSFEFYAGLGARIGSFAGVVIPVGLNIYPFDQKDFGFHMEAAPIIGFNDSALFRGSFGIRYRFSKN